MVKSDMGTYKKFYRDRMNGRIYPKKNEAVLLTEQTDIVN